MVLEVKNLTKVYEAGRKAAVDRVSFTVEEGEIVGLLGPNGAGKTTTIQMLLGLTTPTSGAISYFGKDFVVNREYCLSRINFASAYSQLQSRLTVGQNLTIFAGLYGIPQPQERIWEVLKLLEVEEAMGTLFWKLSSGQKTRVMLAKALLNKPRLILMDEPTASLDPEIANKVIALVQELQQKEKVAILYTSHNMAEVERLCDRVIFLYRGRVIAEDSPLGLTKKVGESRLIVAFDGKRETVGKYLQEHGFAHEFIQTYLVEVRLADTQIPKVLFGLSKAGVWLTEIDIRKPDLEDVFLNFAKGRYERATH